MPGVVHGSQSMLLQDEYGQVLEAHSVSAGLDYPGVGPEHAHLAAIGARTYVPANDEEVLDALQLLARTEGIIPALESAHAVAWVAAAARRGELAPGTTVLITLSGRGDKDAETVMGILEAMTAALEEACAPSATPVGELLVPYMTGGLGGPAWVESLEAMAAGGADAVEIGIPFSDPVMDGPTIQEASQAALDGGATPPKILDSLRGVDIGVPLVAMTYYNLAFRAGHERFAASLIDAGITGAILPDLPLEESGEWEVTAAQHGVASVLLGVAGDARRSTRTDRRARRAATSTACR